MRSRRHPRLLGGVVGGLLGVGGGILFVPALAIFQDKPQVEAEATSLLAIVPVAIVATWRQRGYGNVRLADGLWIGALSPLGVGIGVVVANEVSQRTLELSFAALLLLIIAARCSGDRSATDPSCRVLPRRKVTANWVLNRRRFWAMLFVRIRTIDSDRLCPLP